MSGAGGYDLGLTGRTVVVTGAGSGIGRATALAFAANGARVAVLDRNAEGREQTVAAIVAAGGEALAVECDVSDAASVAAAAGRSAAAFGDCDVLINNAGIMRPGPLETLSLDEWNGVLSVNLTGYLLCAQSFGRQMRNRGRAARWCISPRSRRSTRPPSPGPTAPRRPASRCCRGSSPSNGRPIASAATAVHPGMTRTALSATMYEQPGTSERERRAIPSARIGRPRTSPRRCCFSPAPALGLRQRQRDDRRRRLPPAPC